MCADSKKHSLIDPTHAILAILATFWPKIAIFIMFGQKSDFNQKICCDQPILCKICADSKKHSLIDPTHTILAILATFWPKIEIVIMFGQKSDFSQKICCDQPILCKKMC